MHREELIAQHRKMVHGLAGQLRRELSLPGELDDLVAFGFGGLLEAERRFDPARGVRFQTFAYHRVRGAMLDGIRRMASLPRRAHERLGGEPLRAPTAVPTSLDTAFVRIRASLMTAAPLQGRYGEESPEATLLRHESIERVLAALAELPLRERIIVRGRYFEGRRLDDIAAELGISKSWASRLHTQALRRLRVAVESG